MNWRYAAKPFRDSAWSIRTTRWEFPATRLNTSGNYRWKEVSRTGGPAKIETDGGNQDLNHGNRREQCRKEC